MADYKMLYLSLFYSITNAIESLTKAQKIIENLYVDIEEQNIQSMQDWLQNR